MKISSVIWPLIPIAVFGGSLELPSVFSDHMVLQRERPVPVWGTAEPGSSVTVEFAAQTKTTTVGTDGKWRVDLDPLAASAGSRILRISSKHQLEIINREFSDVLVGEVWFCSGQSNMQMPLRGADNAEAEIAAADHPRIRLYKTPQLFSDKPVEQVDAQWAVCSPETAASFSGVAYYFGRKLLQELDVPVGLLLSSWGGSRIEPWTPPCGFEGIESLASICDQVRHMPKLGANPNADRQFPTALYNGMIHAHIPFAIRGAIWYQGGANHREGMLYVDKSKALFGGWRKLWGYEFPCYFVQVAPFHFGKEDPGVLPIMWEAQSRIMQCVPNTGMAVINDGYSPDNIHPKDKSTPGTRLALLALDNTYGFDLVSAGPVFQTLEKDGGTLKVAFGSADGLTTRDGKAPDWFEVAGADGIFKSAEAKIDGNSVMLHSVEIAAPVAVRFAWHKLASPNLMNGAGLPAAAFRAGDFDFRSHGSQ
ncbi:sialate O-acetylesterase [Pontiellaceae bacterium B12227]|nr:sialate O-acetylesterase [Pontiellaceae bacterium B12227]